MIVQEPVQAAIWHCLNSYDYDDAVFLAERLHVETSSPESMYLLASAYHRSGETAHANYLLRVYGPRTPKLRHLHAITAFKLGRMQEAETLLIGGLSSPQFSRDSVAAYLSASQPPCSTRLAAILQETAQIGYGVHSSFVLKLLGDVYCSTQRPNKACIAFKAALAINPFLFAAFIKLMDSYSGEKSDRQSSCSLVPGANNNNNNTTINNNSNSTPLDTDPNNIFSLDKVGDLSACHGNTLCTVLNTADSVDVSSQSQHRVSSNNITSSVASLSQFTTPATNVLGSNQLFTPMVMSGINLIITPSPAPQQAQEHNSSTSLYQAPRKKRHNNCTSGGNAGVASHGGSGGGMLQPMRLMMTPDTPSFGVLPLDFTAGNSTLSLDHDSSFSSGVDNMSCALLSPLVFTPLDTSSQQPQAPKAANPAFNLARRVLCRSTSNNNTAAGGASMTTSAVSGTSNLSTTTAATGAGGSNNYHSPSSTHPSVRRSSRLFGSASSVKENNKSRMFAAPKSPVRRLKPRTLRPSVTSAVTTPISSVAPSTSTPSANSSLTEINNARNNANSSNINNSDVGGENIMPGADHILTASTADNKAATILSSPDVRDTKPPSNNNNNSSQQPVMVLNQEELSKQALLIQKQAAEGLMTLFRSLGQAYHLLSRFRCAESIDAFQSLPPHHHDTAFVLRSIAKAFFHTNDFQTSASYFQRVVLLAPQLVNELEYYSTALWHLQKEVQLSGLAQNLVSISKGRAAGWCAVGNCFSLQKEHESAIKFFTRAVQVEPSCAYAYTLLGHEHIATEELEKALGCYRTAVRINPRHYNAWYGIGLVLYKQEKYSPAEYHFRKALTIHPDCCVLLCHIAVVQHSMGRSTSALQTLTRALALEPNNAMSRYHRASIYLDLNQPATALSDLNILQPIVPKEANVYLLMGKAHQKLGASLEAQMNFSWALDLDPKGAASAGAGAAAREDPCIPLHNILESPTYSPTGEEAGIEDPVDAEQQQQPQSSQQSTDASALTSQRPQNSDSL